jgi:hypothetical protein
LASGTGSAAAARLMHRRHESPGTPSLDVEPRGPRVDLGISSSTLVYQPDSEPHGRRWLPCRAVAAVGAVMALIVFSRTPNSGVGSGEVGERLGVLLADEHRRRAGPRSRRQTRRRVLHGRLVRALRARGRGARQASAPPRRPHRRGRRERRPQHSVSTIRQLRTAAGDPRYPFAHDPQGSFARALDVTALDTTLVYDAYGEIVYRDAVPTDIDTLAAAFRDAGACEHVAGPAMGFVARQHAVNLRFVCGLGRDRGPEELFSCSSPPSHPARRSAAPLRSRSAGPARG